MKFAVIVLLVTFCQLSLSIPVIEEERVRQRQDNLGGHHKNKLETTTKPNQTQPVIEEESVRQSQDNIGGYHKYKLRCSENKCYMLKYVSLPVKNRVSIVNCFYIYGNYKQKTTKTFFEHPILLTDKSYLRKYRDVLNLFKYVHQLNYGNHYVFRARFYSIESNLDNYTNIEAVQEFLDLYRHGMLPRDEIFSVFNDDHLKQAIALFKVLYYANDFSFFYKTAIWARHYLNQGMFLYSFSVALIHRSDTYSMILPPIYEIYPYYFFKADVIHKAQQYKQQHYKQQYAAELRNSTNITFIKHECMYTSYSGSSLNVPNAEQSLSYFIEDVGINAYYYYYNIYRPFWMNTEEYGINTYYRGEEFYYFYQQLLARYYLERLSNNFGVIALYDYEDGFETGYYSSLRYPNGLAFPERSNWIYFFTNYYDQGQRFSFKGHRPHSFQKVIDLERRIRDAIDLGYIYAEDGQKINLFESDGFNILGNIIESNPDSPNKHFYGYLQIFSRRLGHSYQPLHDNKVVPSALEHFETSLRDPAFWPLYKRLILYFQKYKDRLFPYTYDELNYPGVKIKRVEIDRLITYFENYDINITNSLYVNENEWYQDSFAVCTRQPRLNHKPFTYRINLTSDSNTEAVVRVFIGPKYDEYGRLIHIDENRINFVEFDRFKHELKVGENVIERNSQQNYYASDRTTYKQLYQYIASGIEGSKQFVTHGSEVYYAFPNRLLLPKGSHGGQTYQLYIILSPYIAAAYYENTTREEQSIQHIYEELHEGEEYEYFKYPMVGLGVQSSDYYSLGFPFDKPIDEHNFVVPNSYFQDIVISHDYRIYK